MKLYTVIIASLIVFLSCSKEEKIDAGQIVDNFERSVLIDSRDQNSYKTIIVGDQEWMVENLRFRLKKGSIDGCWSYGEPILDSTKVVIDKAQFKAEVLKVYPNIGKFGNIYMWPWILVDEAFVNSRGGYYTKSWSVFKNESFLPTYGNNPVYEPLIATMDEIANDLYESALMRTLDANVVRNKVDQYGYLYEYRIIDKIAPAGWRIPTDEDFKILETKLGLSDKEINVKEEWRGSYNAFQKDLTMNSGFGGTIIYGLNNQRSAYRNNDFRSYYWTSTIEKEISEVKHVYIRGWQKGQNSTYRGTHVSVNVANSVICVRNLNN